MFVYRIIQKNHYSPETGNYISFSINCSIRKHGRETCFVPDVFISEPESTRAFTRTPEYASGASPIHLIDVIGDTVGV